MFNFDPRFRSLDLISVRFPNGFVVLHAINGVSTEEYSVEVLDSMVPTCHQHVCIYAVVLDF